MCLPRFNLHGWLGINIQSLTVCLSVPFVLHVAVSHEVGISSTDICWEWMGVGGRNST